MMAGIAGGNDDYNDVSPNDGGAKGAKLIMQDVANECDRQGTIDDCFSFIPDDYDLFFGPVYNEGARIHSNSWGTDDPDYFEHPDLFITWSAGNGGPIPGPMNTVGSPANAKGVVAVGWVDSPSLLCERTEQPGTHT
jgi:hypothetical protein